MSPEPKTKVISSWSGGKDCCLALYRAMKLGYKAGVLLNFISGATGRGCFHGLAGSLLRRQAELLGIPLAQRPVSPDMQEYEKEFKAAVQDIRGDTISHMVFGDIYLLDHHSWVQRVCSEIDIIPLQPLWNEPVDDLIAGFCGAGFKAVIISCRSDLLGKEYLGRYVDRELADELKKKGICPCGENGEYHTLVVDGPIFSRPLRILRAEPVKKKGFWEHWFLDIQKFE